MVGQDTGCFSKDREEIQEYFITTGEKQLSALNKWPGGHEIFTVMKLVSLPFRLEHVHFLRKHNVGNISKQRNTTRSLEKRGLRRLAKQLSDSYLRCYFIGFILPRYTDTHFFLRWNS